MGRPWGVAHRAHAGMRGTDGRSRFYSTLCIYIRNCWERLRGMAAERLMTNNHCAATLTGMDYGRQRSVLGVV